jgi:hypothetical protein
MTRLATAALLILSTLSCTAPCTKAARAICKVHSEGDACSWLLDRPRSDAQAQLLCQGVLPMAEDLAADPQSAAALNLWQGARSRLVEAGMQPDPGHGNIDQKLIRAGGVAGHLVDQAEKGMRADEDHVNEAAAHALEGENK